MIDKALGDKPDAAMDDEPDDDMGATIQHLGAAMRHLSKLRHLYVGVVALLVRMHAAMPPQERRWFDGDGDPLARVAGDFNELPFHVEMVRNGSTWILVDRPREVENAR